MALAVNDAPKARVRAAGPRGGATPHGAAMTGLQIPESACTGIGWPALPAPRAAMLLAVQHQFEQSQWWPPETLLAAQLRQLENVLAHAAKTVPFYRERLRSVTKLRSGELTLEAWRRLPILRRRDIQEAGPALVSRWLPKDHGRAGDSRTSGSTGSTITVKGTDLTLLFQRAANLRYHLWHRRNIAGTAACIRKLDGARAKAAAAGKSRPWATGYPSGPMYYFDITKPIGEQLDWLVRLDPEYLLTFPSNLAALLRRSEETGSRPAGLRSVSTMSEVLDPAVRTACDRIWGVPLSDAYSAIEVGMIAMQCPEHSCYHVQAESVLVEVLGEDGTPRGPGEHGRLVVSSLNNFATPLIRYEIGDYAEVGEACPCGRGLPVLKRILGREWNRIVLPNGETRLPYFGEYKDYAAITRGAVRQFQFVQRSLEELEVRLVVSEPLTAEQEEKYGAMLVKNVGYPFRITFSYHDEIPRSASGKFEEFVCAVDR